MLCQSTNRCSYMNDVPYFIYHKILLIRDKWQMHIKDKLDGPISCIRVLIYEEGGGRGIGGYIWKKKKINLQSVKIAFLSFFYHKAPILGYFTSCKMWNMFKVNNKDTRIQKVNDKFKNKDTIEVVLGSLLLTLNTFLFLW